MTKRGIELGKSRGDKGPQRTDGRRVLLVIGGVAITTVTLIVGLIVLAFIAGFVALVVIDSSQRATTEPPEGVEEFNIGPAGQHTQDPVDYEQDPPAGGEHNPVWQTQGFYEEPVRNENAVHTLEHGAVWITYSPDLPEEQKDTLREMVESQDCLLASPYPGLDSPVVASAWGVQARLDGADDPDLERFIRAYRKGPQTPEPGATCAGGTSDTTA